jgi:Ca-activated chloride channel family protein
MKKIILLFILTVFLSNMCYTNGVAIVDGENGIYLSLINSKVEVTVENQVAIVKTTQLFKNQLDSSYQIKYAFPLNEKGSAIELRYQINHIWVKAKMTATPQDTTLPGPGGSTWPDLKDYLGPNPLYYDIKDTVRADSLLKVELTYVELLDYKFGNVQFNYPNNYQLIQSAVIDTQYFSFNLTSSRTIENILLLSSHPIEELSNDGNVACIRTLLLESSADENYQIEYSLNLEELGLFSMSTSIPDSLLPDFFGGFFLFIAEPDPSEQTEIIQKVFTLIIDRSGSMSGNKIIQAKEAAVFIINNLNEGDWFNIIDFESDVYHFRNSHVEYNIQNRDAALSYISGINAGGSTNISGAFDTAIPQFSSTDSTTANIIIFFTDGQATAGITNTDELVGHISGLITQAETNISIFTFGIGNDVDRRLLTQIANNNNGLAEFLANNEVEDRITEFYLQIRNPVLVNTHITFSSPDIAEVYPDPLPNLYIGQQMIVAGRYTTQEPVEVMLQGTAFGNPVSYEYQLDLADTAIQKNQFLTKVWAKLKIEHLLIEYYLLDPNSYEAETIKQQIIEISMCYGVISPFTSFSGGEEDYSPNEIENLDHQLQRITPNSFTLIGNYPNPFNPSTTIRFSVNIPIQKMIKVKIYNALGQLIRILTIQVSGPGIYEIFWNGFTQNGIPVSSGTYIYLIDYGDGYLAGKMQLIK